MSENPGHRIARALLLSALAMLVGLPAESAAEESPPLRFCVIPFAAPTKVKQRMQRIEEIVQATSGVALEVAVPASYLDLLTEATSGACSLMLVPSQFAALLIEDFGYAELAVLGRQVFATVYVLRESPIESVAMLRGRTIAYGDVYSTLTMALRGEQRATSFR